MKRYIEVALASAALLLAPGIARAADIASPMVPELTVVERDGWTFAISPYFWAAGISGDTTQFGLPTVHLDSSFSDIFDELEFGAMAIGEARYDRYSLFGDLMYSKISSGSGTPRGIIADHVDVTSETFSGLFGGGYSIFKDDKSYFDLVAGARVWYVNTDISFDGGVLDGVDVSDNATWVDGMAGFRGKYALTDKFFLTGWGLIGAGGADLDWDVAGGVGYNFNDRFSAVLGYRALGVDYSNDGFVYDVVQQGPIMGAVIHF